MAKGGGAFGKSFDAGTGNEHARNTQVTLRRDSYRVAVDRKQQNDVKPIRPRLWHRSCGTAVRQRIGTEHPMELEDGRSSEEQAPKWTAGWGRGRRTRKDEREGEGDARSEG